MAKESWGVEFHPGCETWAQTLPQPDAEALLAAIRVLRDQGPNLGRPLVDTVKGSRHANMKELRPGSTGRTEVRVLFAFDRERKAILLLGGDKSRDWSGVVSKEHPGRRRSIGRAPSKDRCEDGDTEEEREREATMSLKKWERKVLRAPGAAGRVAEIEDELRLAAGLTALREQAGLSQRELAKRIGVSQPRVAAIERSRNVTIDVLEQYVDALGGALELAVVKGSRRISLVSRRAGMRRKTASRAKAAPKPKRRSA